MEQKGWFHSRFTPSKRPGSPSDVSPLHPCPPALPKAPWSIPHVTATVWPLLSKPHSTQIPLKVPPGSRCSSDLFNKCVLGNYCVSGTVLGTRAQSRKQNRPKVLPSWNFLSEGREMVNKANSILEGERFIEKKRMVNRNEKCGGWGEGGKSK